MKYWVYILYSPSLDRYYIGHTNDIDNRLTRHNSGYERATKSGIPWTLEYTEVYSTRSQAMQRERELKAKKSRKYIEWLISQQ